MPFTRQQSSIWIRRAIYTTTALSLAISALAHAGEPWVSTKTKALLPLIQPESTVQTSGVTTKAASTASDLAPSAPVHITVGLKLRNEYQLDQQINYLQSGGSRQFLTPAQFNQSYSPTQEQVNSVVNHLRKSGFTNIVVAPNRLLITATGTAANVKTAFNTTLRHFKANDGRDVFANATDVQVPQSLGSIVQTVLGLQNVALAHTFHKLQPTTLAAHQKQLLAAATATPTQTGHYPLEFPAIYGASSVPTAANTTVGIITWGNLNQTISDLNTFTSKNGLPAVTTSVVQTGSAGRTYSNGDPVEWNLDSQSIVGAASGHVQKIIFYTAPTDSATNLAFFDDLTNAFNRAVTDNSAKIINVSLGWCESDSDATSVTVTNDAIFKQAVAQGQTFSVSSGDAGVYQCSTTRTGYPGKPYTNHYTVSAPASSPYVVAVGGTALSTAGTGVYSSEVTWNEGLAQANPPTDTAYRLWATGGGYSTIEPAPSWQSSTLTGSSKRALPDIAFDAAQASGAILYINGSTTFTQNGSTYLNQVGGTSLSSPLFVGFYARLQSANNNTLGFPASSFYNYFPTNTSLLHDVTSGYNGYGSYPGYNAKAGWDATTGFGSIDIGKLYNFIQANPGFGH